MEFLVTNPHQHNIRQYILHDIIPHLLRNGFSSINGIAVGFVGSLLGTRTVVNYAEVLKRNLSATVNNFNQESLNTNVFRKRKQLIPSYNRDGNPRGTSETNSTRNKHNERK